MKHGRMSQTSVCSFARFDDGHGYLRGILLHLIKAGTLTIVGKSCSNALHSDHLAICVPFSNKSNVL